MDSIEGLVDPAAAAGQESSRGSDSPPSGTTVLSGAGAGAAAIVAGAALIVVLALTVVVSRVMSPGASNPHAARPDVGPDVHSVMIIDSAVLLGGHDRAARSADRGLSWDIVSGLAGVDVMAWATSGDDVLAGGHGGLHRSLDGGLSFSRTEGAAGGLDIHALGAQGATVFAASPVAGLMRSTDRGTTWRSISTSVGTSLMGAIAIDAANPDSLAAVAVSGGVVLSGDGGATWRSAGLPQATSVAMDPRDAGRLLVTTPGGGALSSDGGASWQQVAMPPGTSVVTFDGTGTWMAAALVDAKAWTYVSADGGASWLPTNG